jgi:membrane fusion protein (multidrug efflux system)
MKGTRTIGACRGLLALLAICMLASAFAACGNDNGRTPNGYQPKDQAQAGNPGAAPELPPATVAVELAARGDIASHYSSTATLDPDKQATVLARVSGVVLSILIEEGDQVKQGQELLRIEDDEYRYRLKSAQTELENLQARFQRMQEMYELKMIPAEQYEQLQAEMKTAEDSRELAALNLSYTRVTAPFAGRVVRRLVDPGQAVSNGTELFTLADMNRLLARVHVPAKEFQSIQVRQPVALYVDSTKQTLEGQISLISPVVDPQSGTIKVTVEITAYPPNIRAGDFAEVRIVTAQHLGTLLVPKSAVLTDKGEQVVFVADGNTARRRVVKTGFQNETHAEITAGLAEGEQVITQGQRSLKDGQGLKILPAIDYNAPAEAKA